MSLNILLNNPAPTWTNLNANSFQVAEDFQCTPLTTAVRDATIPTPSNGMIIFNSDTTTFQGYLGGVWKNIIAGTTGGSGTLTATQVTATPTGQYWSVGSTNVQLALNALYQSIYPPAASCEHVGFTLAAGSWINAGVVFNTGNSRPTVSPLSWVGISDGVQDALASTTGRNYILCSATLVCTGPATGYIMIRILKNGAPNVVCQGQAFDDGLGGTIIVTTSCMIIDAVNDIFTVQILNQTSVDPITVTRCEMDLFNFGPI